MGNEIEPGDIVVPITDATIDEKFYVVISCQWLGLDWDRFKYCTLLSERGVLLKDVSCGLFKQVVCRSPSNLIERTD